MPPLPAPRASQCLLCTLKLAAKRPSHHQRLLPHIQVAYRSGGARKKPVKERRYDDGKYSPQQTQALFQRTGKSHFSPSFLRGRNVPFAVLVPDRMRRLRALLTHPDFFDSLGLTREFFQEEWNKFEKTVQRWMKESSKERESLEVAAQTSPSRLERQLKYSFYAQVYSGRFTRAELENQKKVADLRHPSEWYPATRELSRTVHLHVGPTNSGKTYHALKRLEQADKGVYLGPLRLLAHEVYTRLNAKGKTCALVTGEEQRIPEGQVNMWSCTVEMAPLNTALDVAVIDEIQMIAHHDRGWAWTSAFLGIKAKEVHLCGEARTVPLIRELCALIGDKVQVHEYKRLTPLQLTDRSLCGDLTNLQKGDCIVAFSVLGIHAMRREVEKKTGRKCAMVYGSLPPETRAQQARLFNDPDNDYDFMVASDAIGMGLNLSIKRIIFESTLKSNGSRLVPLEVAEIKQIAGRAGRYKTAQQAVSEDQKPKDEAVLPSDAGFALERVKTNNSGNILSEPPVGYVTTFEQYDFKYLKDGMLNEPKPISTAGLFPPSLIVERFASYFPPETPFGYIMLRLHELAKVHSRFHLCSLRDFMVLADAIHTVKNLTIPDRITLCAAPVDWRSPASLKFLHTLATCIADNKSGELLDLEGLPLEVMDKPPTGDREYLYDLEQLHKMLVTYLWLSYRFPNVFTTRALAVHTKGLVEQAIEDTLMRFSWTEEARRALQKKREEARRKIELEAQVDHWVKGEEEDPRSESDAVQDVLRDEQAFDENPRPAPGPVDDEGEYPMAELDVLQPSKPSEPSEADRSDSQERVWREGTNEPPLHAAQAELPAQMPPAGEQAKAAESNV